MPPTILIESSAASKVDKTGMKGFYRLFSALLGLTFTQLCYAEELPLWEFGFGAGGLHLPYYSGTKDTRIFAFPVPLIVYRGDVFKSDDEGIRAQLSKTQRYKLDISLDFNPAVDSDEVELRQGLPDVDNLLQIGPSLEVTLSKRKQDALFLRLPVRSNLAIGGNSINQAGYTFSPNIAYIRHLSSGNTPWRTGLSVGPQFGDSDFHAIYYGVEQEFATTNRPEYNAGGGYSGARALLTLTSKSRKRLLAMFLRYDNISGATFDDSPLVETNHNVTFGFIYSHYLFKSKTTASN